LTATVNDRKLYASEIPDSIGMKGQQRAYTAPIWYPPETEGDVLMPLTHFGRYLVVGALAASSATIAQIHPSAESLSEVYPGRAYSPYAERSFPTFPLWGETHLHTGYSLDAGLFGNRLLHEQAYRFAIGEQIQASSGQPVKMSRPLDWISIADHSDMMGFVQGVMAGESVIMASEQGRRWNAGMNEGGQSAVEAALDLIATFSATKIDPTIVEAYAPGSPKYATIWQDMLDTAEDFNDPGRFTTLIAFEWTSLVNGGNMHRNVIFRDGADKASQVVPYTQTPPFGSSDPLDLYNYLEGYEEKTGGTVMAISHNGNLSNGIMFPVDRRYDGSRVDKDYVQARNKWEPLYEVTQMKGDGEAHPFLSPEDEFADYETWDVGNLDLSAAKTDDMLQYEYAREALKNGLVLEGRLGTNPYKFGLVGATDSHTSMATAEEENFMGKHSGYEASPERMTHPFMNTESGRLDAWQMAASGYQAVYATENTRESIFDAMQRKETSRQPAFLGYEKGVPMGGDLRERASDASPSFMVYALRDPIGANLDRIQIVKGWVDKRGKTHEKVYDVSWSGDRRPGADGKLPPVGNTVDVEGATWTNSIGDSELITVWVDPDFDPKHRAFYYARVLEIPTPRWIVYDAFRYGIDLPKGATTSAQERAYTSPIWYTP
jgi:Protein of unknown function (DUF3604)